MKPHTLMLVLMSGALLACQSQQGQLTAERQISTQLPMRFAHDPTGEKELLYLRGLLKMPEHSARSMNETREALWSRQQRKADVMYELVSFYGRYPQQPDKAKLAALIRQMDRQLAPNQRIWLWALVRLPDELKTQTTPVELQTLCQQIAANTPTFGYVQPSTLQLCRRAQLLLQRKLGSNDVSAQIAAINGDLQAHRLQNSDLLPLMDILQSSAYGNVPMNDQAIALGRLAGEQEPAVELAVISLLLNSAGDQAETSHLESRLLQLRQQGEKQASFLLGRLYFEGRRKVADPVKAEQVLKTVKELPEASYLLGRLYLSGILGEPSRVQEGVDLLVQAARKGYVKADELLAEAFFDAPGVKANPVYAWVFASLTLQERPDNLRVQRLLAALTLDEKKKRDAQILLKQEYQARNMTGESLQPQLQIAQQVSDPNVQDSEPQVSTSVSNL